MTCDKIFAPAQLLNMALRPDDAGNFIVDTIETAVDDACTPFDQCDEPWLPFLALISGLFEERQPNCWAVRINSRSASGCDYYFTCDNNDVTWQQALRRSITKGSDGKPVLNVADIGSLSPFDCDDFQSFMKALFWTDGDCVAVRVGGGGSFDPCAAFDCSQIPGGWMTALHRSIGIAAGNCPAFFFNIGAAVNDCSIPDLMAGFFECVTPYFLVADPTNGVSIGSIHFLWEQSTDHTTWTFVAEGDGLTSAQFLPLTNPQFMRVTMSCGEYSLTREMDIGFAFLSQLWALNHWLTRSINGGAAAVLNPNDVFWLAEGETITLINSNSGVLQTQFQSGTLYGGPNRTITKGTADNQTLYEEVGTIFILDNQTFPGDGCLISLPYEVHFVPNPIVSSPNNFVCVGSSATLTANYGANTSELYTTYQWYKDNNIIGGATSKTYDADVAGTYKCVCTHHGKTVTSNNFVVSVQTDIPQPYVVFEKTTPSDSEFIYNLAGNKVYVPSDTSLGKVTVQDAGPYAGGYPAGTLFEFVGLTAPQILNYYDLVTSTSLIQVIVTLPNNLGGCSVTSENFFVDFASMQAAQITGQVEIPCVLGSGQPPDDGTYWTFVSEDCLGSGNSTWFADTSLLPVLFPYTLDLLTPGQVTINCPMKLTDPNTDLDMSANVLWYKLYDLATDTWLVSPTLVQTGGTSLVVTSPGVYGVVSSAAPFAGEVSNTIVIGFGYINFIVPTIP